MSQKLRREGYPAADGARQFPVGFIAGKLPMPDDDRKLKKILPKFGDSSPAAARFGRSQELERLTEILRQGRLKHHFLTGARMFESQFPRVQEHPRWGVTGLPGEFPILLPTIDV